MTATATEILGSRRTSGDDQGMELETRWIVDETNNELEAISAMLTEAGDDFADPYGGLPLTRRSFSLEQTGHQLWEGSVTFATPNWNPSGSTQEQPDEATVDYSFDTTGATTKITQSLATTSYGADAPDHKGAINVTKDSVEGVEIVVPALTWTETHQIPRSLVTVDYIKTLSRMSGKVNASEFRGFAAGEVLYHGASGSTQGGTTDLVPVQFKFEASENTTEGNKITIGDLADIDKDGHEYLWVQYEEVDDTDAQVVTRNPKWVFVEQVYEEADFSILGIGTT